MRMLIPVQNFLPSRLASPLPFQYQSRFESSFVERDGISSSSFFQGVMASRVRDRLVSGMNAYVSHSQRSRAKPTLASRPSNSAQEKNSLLRGRLRPILLPHQNSTQSTSRTGARGNVPENNSEVKYSIYPEPRFARITWKETLKNCLHVLTFFSIHRKKQWTRRKWQHGFPSGGCSRGNRQSN